MLHAEAFQILHLKVLQQPLARRGLGEHPVVQLEGEELVAELCLEVLPLAALKQHLLGCKAVEQLVHIVGRPLGGEELTRRDVQESHAAKALAQVDGGQEVVLLVVQYVVVDGHARCHQLRDAPLHQLLGQLGVFQLVTDGHALARPDKLGQVRVQRVVGESRHLQALAALAVVALGQGDAQYLGSHHGIRGIRLIEIPATKQHHGIGMFRLQVEKLLYHGGKGNVFCLHVFCFSMPQR